MSKRASFVAVLILALAALLAWSMPAFAHHKDGHEQGGRPAAEEEADASSTEDSSKTNENSDDATDDDDDNRHPSGKDRETNNGPTDDVQGGDQTSNPDNDGRGPERSSCDNTSADTVGGCADKPGGTGGVDQEDQDWNNGCGNDDDFEDDNEGWCGKPPADTTVLGGTQQELCPAGTARAGMAPGKQGCGTTVSADDDNVLGEVITKPEVQVREANPADDVLGTRFTAAPRVAAAAEVAAAPAGVLPFTGTGMIPFLFIGLAMIASGVLVARRGRA